MNTFQQLLYSICLFSEYGGPRLWNSRRGKLKRVQILKQSQSFNLSIVNILPTLAAKYVSYLLHCLLLYILVKFVSNVSNENKIRSSPLKYNTVIETIVLSNNDLWSTFRVSNFLSKLVRREVTTHQSHRIAEHDSKKMFCDN